VPAEFQTVTTCYSGVSNGRSLTDACRKCSREGAFSYLENGRDYRRGGFKVAHFHLIFVFIFVLIFGILAPKVQKWDKNERKNENKNGQL
jgi:hypothetical protein